MSRLRKHTKKTHEGSSRPAFDPNVTPDPTAKTIDLRELASASAEFLKKSRSHSHLILRAPGMSLTAYLEEILALRIQTREHMALLKKLGDALEAASLPFLPLKDNGNPTMSKRQQEKYLKQAIETAHERGLGDPREALSVLERQYRGTRFAKYTDIFQDEKTGELFMAHRVYKKNGRPSGSIIGPIIDEILRANQGVSSRDAARDVARNKNVASQLNRKHGYKLDSNGEIDWKHPKTREKLVDLVDKARRRS